MNSKTRLIFNLAYIHNYINDILDMCNELDNNYPVIFTDKKSQYAINICNRYEINIISVSVLMAVIETILMNLILFKDNNNRADFYIKENKIKWYIYKKINVNYILCGNKINRSESDKIKLIKSDPNLIFYRVPSEKQNE